ncbi:MAG TPA: hypothetical protein VNK41_06190 [Vicinamibacterales bacterium]|nr:hypothetical protein [Vicinamibacterales bacterium]
MPANTCGAYRAATLGVATFAFAPDARRNRVTPLVAASITYAGFKILREQPPVAGTMGAGAGDWRGCSTLIHRDASVRT